MRYSILVTLLSLLPATLYAQAFEIGQSFPEHGDTNVSLSETIAFSYNREVSVSTDWNTEFVYEPSNAVRLNRVSLCLNFQGSCGGGNDVPRHVRFGVDHEPSTDYTWLVYAVESADGDAMTTPYVLRYTTASDIGQGRIRGSVGTPALAQKQSRSVHATLRRLADGLKRSGLGRPIFDGTNSFTREVLGPAASENQPQARFGTLGRKAADGPFTQILLVDEFSIRESSWSVSAADVLIGSSGSYSLDFVRPGSYVPIAVRYTEGANREIDALGFHDPDGDGTPNTVDVDGNERAGISLQLFSFPLTTARDTDNIEVATDSAAQYASDQELRLIQAGNGMRPAGSAYEWSYRFYSPSQDLETRVTVNPLEVQVDTSASPGFLTDMSTIPAGFIDSDEALQIALNDGGQEFIDPFRPRNLTTILEGGNLFWTDAPKPQEEFWRVRIIAATSSQVKIFERFINIQTGEFLPVELTDFTATADGSAARLRWMTASETNNAGFEVQHAPGSLSSAAWSTLGFVEGAGTTQEPQTYQFGTGELEPGSHRFRLKQVDTDGTTHLSDVVRVTLRIQHPLRLTAPAPHPVRGSATLQFGLRSSQPTTVVLYDMLGRRITTLYEGTPAPHQMNTVRINADDMPSGLYFVRLRAGNHTETRRVTIVK
jgi:hypothetical protein